MVYIRLHPPEKGDTEICPASQWRLDMKELEDVITEKTRMIVINTPSVYLERLLC